jgi:hypothetical protein
MSEPGALLLSRADVIALLALWRDGALGPAELKAAIAGKDGADAIAHEALAELDLMEVHLLTPDDVPALCELLGTDDPAAADDAIARWARHRDAIDLDARSRALKKTPFYRAFCR